MEWETGRSQKEKGFDQETEGLTIPQPLEEGPGCQLPALRQHHAYFTAGLWLCKLGALPSVVIKVSNA